MGAPIIPIIGLGLCGYAMYRAFDSRNQDRAGAHNNWKNEDFASRERVGNWSEGSKFYDPDYGTWGSW